MNPPMAVKIAPWLIIRAGLLPAMIVPLAIAYPLCRRELPVPRVVLVLLAAFVAGPRLLAADKTALKKKRCRKLLRSSKACPRVVCAEVKPILRAQV